MRAHQLQGTGLSSGVEKEKELVSVGIAIAHECQSACVRQLCLAKQIADELCGKQSTFGIVVEQEFDGAEPVLFILPVRFNRSISLTGAYGPLSLHCSELLVETSDPRHRRSS